MASYKKEFDYSGKQVAITLQLDTGSTEDGADTTHTIAATVDDGDPSITAGVLSEDVPNKLAEAEAIVTSQIDNAKRDTMLAAISAAGYEEV